MKTALAGWVAIVLFAGSLLAADLSQFTTADALWAHLEELQHGPKQRARTREQAQAMLTQLLADLDESAAAFVKQYPADPRRWDARLMQLDVAAIRADLAGKKPDRAGIEAQLQEVVKAKDASAAARSAAAFGLIQLHAGPLGDSGVAAAVGTVDTEILAFIKQYPSDSRLPELQFLRVQLWQKSDPAKSEAVLQDLAKSDDAKVAAEASQQLLLIGLKHKPFELKFTALDGAAVDLSNLRGKVVLVDFWATWCGPCRREIPGLVATYKKYHDRGFEIVGISLDKDKDRLTQHVANNEMTWPEYFDGKAWQNEISSKFGIKAIPAQWLLDKKGFLRVTEINGDLDVQVQKLLAE